MFHVWRLATTISLQSLQLYCSEVKALITFRMVIAMLFVSYLCNLARAMGWWIVHLLIDLPKLGLHATYPCSQITLNGTYFRSSYFWRKVCRPSPVFRFVTFVRSETSSKQRRTTTKMRSIEDLLASDNHPHTISHSQKTRGPNGKVGFVRSCFFFLSTHVVLTDSAFNRC